MLSIIIPFYNERDNLVPLYHELQAALKGLTDSAEIIFVDDGSTDEGSAGLQPHLREQVRLISLRKRFGKGEALATGLKRAKGEIIIFMDSDLQDSPKDISQMVKLIHDGYDLVNGARHKRADSLLIRMYSTVFNRFLRRFLQSPFSDINCGFKAMRRAVFADFILYGNNFRFLPLAVYYLGYRVTETPVHNRPRQFGVSKFGPGKALIGMFDTLSAFFIYQFAERPLHFFGMIGTVSFGIGFVIAIILSIGRIFYGMLLYRRPSLLLAITLMIVGIQIVMTGIIGELIVYLNKKKPN